VKVGLVFDNQQRPETTGYYCRRALGPLVDVEHLLPHELNLIDPSIFDLFLFIDDGLDYPIPAHCRPRAAWAIDTHIALSRSIQRFGDADHLFAAQKNGAAALQQATGRKVHWLPLGCDPEIHRPIPNEAKCHDVGFVGHVIGRDRERLLNELAQRYPSSWFGQALFDDMCRMYARSRVGFNCSVADDLNMRLFEIPACGIPIVTNHIESNGLDELFDIGKHLLTYHSDDDLFSCIDRLLNDRGFAEQVAVAGHRRVLQNHTYHHRMVSLLNTVTATRSTVAVGGKSGDYFEFDRPDVRALIPATAQRILDIGCASGRLGQALKSEQDCHVTGVEADPAAAKTAGARLDRVVECSIESLPESAFDFGTFDCIVLADVLEHLRKPLDVLRKCRSWLMDNGSLVISVPNSRHHSVISGLMDGNWTYERAGLLDDDHVRCFTRRELEKLLYRAGFEICQRVGIPGSGYEEWKQSGNPRTVRICSLAIEGLTSQDAEEFFIYQHLVRSQPSQRCDYGLTSIIIATFNQLWATRQCIDSLLTRTDENIELIFVDNGSTDGTPDYLRSIPGARVILNSTNRGFAPAVNQGLQVATGQQLLLLNNDCIVTTGWLEGLLEALYDDSFNGLIGPVSNNVSGEQQIPVSYSDLTSLDGFAWDRRSHRELTDTDRLVGFCLLFRREVMDRIGLLDEQFEVGCFEDDDFCRRAKALGYRAVIANHVFVHHFGSATFRGSGVDFTAIMAKNEQRYRDKWDSTTANPTSSVPAARQLPAVSELADRYSVLTLDGGDVLLQRKHIRLSLCMIVRDNEDTIEACLDSIYPWVDEIVVVDTGSTDRTPEICRRFGARMFEFPWCDDFSAARNVSLEPARGEWIFWMDSDDVIDQEQGRKLRALAYGLHPDECFGYVAQVHCESSEPGQMTTVDHVKMFRNLPGLRFEHRIHEQILPAIRRAGGSVAFTDLFVIHKGSIQTPEVRLRKLERDFRILQLDLERYPNHPFVLFNLGMTYEDAGQYDVAEMQLRRCLDVSMPQESHVRKTWALLVNSIRQQGRIEEALETASHALQIFPGDKELLFRRATLFQDNGQPEQAIEDYQRILSEDVNRVFVSVDPSITGHKLHSNLALAFKDLGNIEGASHHWRLAIQECPQFVPAWIALAQVLVDQHRQEDLQALILEIPAEAVLTSTLAILTAYLSCMRGDFLGMQRTLSIAWTITGNADCLDELCRLLTEQNMLQNALPYLEQLRAVRPTEPAVLHNLGITLHACGRTVEGMQVLTKCLELNPNRINTICQLSRIYQEAGDVESLRRMVLNGIQGQSQNATLDEIFITLNEWLDQRDAERNRDCNESVF
jgi:GT2 family glycosyltransferase/tetratricopeptide (TPR) repeat protein/2-polyprenyl-3-methyl-5-hydroxy-6-metoxy-1,4-benzoquinol methylase